MAVLGYIWVNFINATEELMTGIDILIIIDYITFIYLINVLLSQNLNNIPLNHAFVLYRAFFKHS